jgi:hypothetical protein
MDGSAPGTYNVQAVLNIYQTFHRADGHTVKLHADHGEGQQWNRSPGNLYSKPQKIEVGASSVTTLELTEVIPPIEPPKDTKYIRHPEQNADRILEAAGIFERVRVGAARFR